MKLKLGSVSVGLWLFYLWAVVNLWLFSRWPLREGWAGSLDVLASLSLFALIVGAVERWFRRRAPQRADALLRMRLDWRRGAVLLAILVAWLGLFAGVWRAYPAVLEGGGSGITALSILSLPLLIAATIMETVWTGGDESVTLDEEMRK